MDICGYNMLHVELRKLLLFDDSELTPVIKELIHSNSRIETCNIHCHKVGNDAQAAVRFSRSKNLWMMACNLAVINRGTFDLGFDWLS
jgi:hypothetical protein